MAEQTAAFDLALRFDAAEARKVERLYLTPDVIEQRARVLALLQLRPGERVADLGCGPGLLAQSMAQAVGPRGVVQCIDNSEPMVSLAQRRCAGFPFVHIEPGDVTKLKFPDASLDAAVCMQVYEYVANLEQALKEMHRVLQPGARALIVDTDWESAVWANSDRERMRKVMDAWDLHCAHPQLPRSLAEQLRRAGLEVERIEVVSIVNAQLDANTYSHGMIGTIAKYASTRGGIDRDVASAWADDLRVRTAPGEYFFSLNRYVFLARRLR